MLVVTLRGEAVSDCEIYAPTGVLEGTADVTLVTADGADITAPFAVGDATWFPLDGAAPTRAPILRVAPDDMLVVVTPPPQVMIHMTTYRIALEVGPYRLTGGLSTYPGFDPEKSISRPGGAFIPLREVTIELMGHPEAGVAEREHVHVNRYAVERVSAPIMLGHFFPGAQLETNQVAVPA